MKTNHNVLKKFILIDVSGRPYLNNSFLPNRVLSIYRAYYLWLVKGDIPNPPDSIRLSRLQSLVVPI